ncbi:unnamed protein product [Ceutorhynchus assimilis]|uniref:Uncharacterized protein n=1 Tax=Ceutorhynchus assimilis TaxID=467358 RepID=A0A9N9QLL5_9CUCU|nr:unnamed protein product [Ceutorhynchus assimilis]
MSPPATRYKRKYDYLCTQTQCRICLSHCLKTGSSLGAPLDEIQNPEIQVVEALELLANETVPRGANYPDTVCRMCFGFLKIAYDLIAQFKKSKEILSGQLNKAVEQFVIDIEPKRNISKQPKESEEEFSDDIIVNNELVEEAPIRTNKDVKAPVELFVGTQKFDIKELCVIESEEEDDLFTFDGFLQNLGTTITATFVEKGYHKPKLQVEAPSLVIEKIIQEEIPDEPDNDDENHDDIPSDPPPDPRADLIFKLEKSLDPKYEDETIFMNEPNMKAFDSLVLSNENEKSAIRSALKLNFKCPYCLKPISTLARAKKHSRKCNKNTQDVHCYVCDVSYNNRIQLLTHIKESHMNEIKYFDDAPNYLPSEKDYKCHICDEIFENRKKLIYHIKKHSGRNYGCDKCDKKFFTQDNATKHAKTHNKDQTAVICQICGKGFHYKTALYYHLKIHAGERNLQCSYCPKRYYTTNSLKRHELAHTGERPYSCEFCDKKFRSVGETKKHQLAHTGERPHKCKYCGSGFTSKYNLKLHMHSHQGKYECSYCHKGFVDSDILKFHLQKSHRGELERLKIEEAQADDIEDSDYYPKESAEVAEEVPIEDSDYYATDLVAEEVPIEYSEQLFEGEYEGNEAVVVENIYN